MRLSLKQKVALVAEQERTGRVNTARHNLVRRWRRLSAHRRRHPLDTVGCTALLRVVDLVLGSEVA